MHRSFPARALLVIALTALASALPASPAFAKPCKYQHITPTEENVAQARYAVRCLLNKERRRRDRKALRASGTLRDAAQRYAENMVRNDFFGHVTPGGRTLLDRIVDVADSYVENTRRFVLGENVAWGAGDRATPRETVIAWMQSPGHKANILNRRFRHIGVGIAEGAPADVGDAPAATYATEFGARG